MLKGLFTFHSKEEDHRVMCLILILLGVALLINPASATWSFPSYMDNTDSILAEDVFVKLYDNDTYDYTFSNDVVNRECQQYYSKNTMGYSNDGTLYTGLYGPPMSSYWLPNGGDPNYATTHTFVNNASERSVYCHNAGDGTDGNCIWVLWNYCNDGSWPRVPTLILQFNTSSSLPSAPVINDFTKDATCYAPAEAIVLESNVTGTVDTWLWEIYDDDDVQVWSSADSVETIVNENFAPGLYQVQLYVENTGGNDFLSKDNWLNITQAGGCGPIGNWTNPFPTTTVTTIPTQQFYETMTMPPHIVTNMSGINEEINKGIFANMSQGYRDYVDYVGEQANTTFTGTFRTLLSPVTLVVNAISYAIGLFSTSINALTVYTTVPLAITAIIINYMPWQIVTLITAGIAIDAILIIILGR